MTSWQCAKIEYRVFSNTVESMEYLINTLAYAYDCLEMAKRMYKDI